MRSEIKPGLQLTISNVITISRLIMLPFIVFYLLHQKRTIAFILILISLISDGIDGYLARKLHQESKFGKFLDPLCDKISLAVILIALLIINSIPLWAVAVIVGRDLLILLGSYVILKQRSIVLTSNILGKITGFIFGVMILAYTINIKRVAIIFLYLSIPVMIGTFISYVQNYIKLMKGAK